MAAFPKWNPILLHLHQFKFHTLPFSVRCQHMPQHFAHFAHSYATWKTETQHFSVRNQERQWQSICNLLFTLSSVLGFDQQIPPWPNPTRSDYRGNSVGTCVHFTISLHKICASYSVTYSDGSLLHSAVHQIWRKIMTVTQNLPKTFKVKLKPLSTPWEYIGGIELIFNHGVRWRWMVNFQFWPLHIEKEAGWVLEVVWTSGEDNSLLLLPGIESQTVQPVASWLWLKFPIFTLNQIGNRPRPVLYHIKWKTDDPPVVLFTACSSDNISLLC